MIFNYKINKVQLNWMVQIQKDSYVVAIFLGNFGIGLLHTAFNFYYVKVSFSLKSFFSLGFSQYISSK
jgi:hypothetical protein